MNAAHPDDNDAEIADDEGTQESDNSDQQAEKAKSEPPAQYARQPTRSSSTNE